MGWLLAKQNRQNDELLIDVSDDVREKNTGRVTVGAILELPSVRNVIKRTTHSCEMI